MKRFVCKCLLLSLLVGGLLYAGGVYYARSTNYRNIEIAEETDKFHQMPESIDIAVFGPSHARDAFAVAPEGKTFFNFALGAQLPVYDLRLMREYGDRFHEGTVVLLNATYLSPFWTETEESFQEKQPRYYRILSAKNIVDVDLPKYCIQRFSPMLSNGLGDVIASFVSPAALRIDVEEGRRVRMPTEGLEKEKDRIRKDVETLIMPAFPKGDPELMEAYREMLRMCKDNGWQAVLVTPPYLRAYNEVFEEYPDFYPIFYGLVQGLSEEFGVPWLDLSHDEEYAEAYELYRNLDHMNIYGAERFAPRFYSQLEELLAE